MVVVRAVVAVDSAGTEVVDLCTSPVELHAATAATANETAITRRLGVIGTILSPIDPPS